jgi:hypothetical protein
MSTDTAEKTEAPAEATEAPETKAAAPKVVDHPCLCGRFEVKGETDDEIFSTGCEALTKRVFAQGHDARLISFLVDGYFDGYTLRYVTDAETVATLATPAEAAALASEALRDKAAKATENRKAKVDAKEQLAKAREAKKAEKAKEKAAADKVKADAKAAAKEVKAAAPKTTGAEVVAGSAEGDKPTLPEGMTIVKVGRWEYEATIDPETGAAIYVDGKGVTVTTERDGYRLLNA